LLLAVFCFAGRGVACSTLFSLGYSKDSAKILVVSADFLNSAGVIFHPVWEQQEGSGCFWKIKADVVACCATLSMCLLSYTGWQMENPVNYIENASVLEPNILSLGWAVHDSWSSGVKL